MTYTKQDGKWLTISARDLPDDRLTPEEQLKQLQWMIGEWVDECPEALVITSYHWTDNQCYILSEFKVQVGGRPMMTGTQRIGWDPLAKKDPLLGLRLGRRVWRRDLDPRGQSLDREKDRRNARRKGCFGDQHHYPTVQGPHDVATARSHRRRGADAGHRRNVDHT